MLVLELVPAELAGIISKEVKAATIGIGAGPGTDGQVLVFPDVLGYTERNFRHNKRYAEVGAAMKADRRLYRRCPGRASFPTTANCAAMPAEVLARFRGESSRTGSR